MNTDDTIETEDQLEEVVSDEAIEESNEEPVEESTEETEDTSSEDENEDTDEDTQEDEETISQEKLDSLNDDEFLAFLNSGKLPSKSSKVATDTTPKVAKTATTQNAKIVAKPAAKQTVEETPKEDTSIDYKSAYESIFKPFKANGKEITPRTVNDVISLMQMGANYTKKMQAIAPMKKAMTSLTNAKINEEDLNFLIDLHKGDKEAIKKLLQKNNVDPMDLDLESTNYRPNNNIASDDDVDFQEVLQDLGDNLPTVENIVNHKWDAESKRTLLKNPSLLRKLGEEVQLGRFDAIQNILEEQKTFGRYKGVSDLEAYTDIVTKYVNYQQQQQANQNKNTQNKTITKNVPDKSKAAPTRSKPNKQSVKFSAKDLLSMSDEDFEKLTIKDLI